MADKTYYSQELLGLPGERRIAILYGRQPEQPFHARIHRLIATTHDPDLAQMIVEALNGRPAGLT